MDIGAQRAFFFCSTWEPSPQEVSASFRVYLPSLETAQTHLEASLLAASSPAKWMEGTHVRILCPQSTQHFF